MTDSMKFGPEWLRNMSNDMNNVSAGSSSSTTSIIPKYQLAEHRYGREEMLQLFDRNLKTPEVLPNFKKLYIEKAQNPLAFTPNTEDEIMSSTPQWKIRSPVQPSFTGTGRGTGRGGSVDRGRTRTRANFHHSSIGYHRPMAMYDDDVRALTRNERSWPERNGGPDVGNSDWNGSPSSSPRKEFHSLGRGSNNESWRRSRNEDEVGGDGWRNASNSGGNNNNYRWSRSASWREDDAQVGSGETTLPSLVRSSERNNLNIPALKSNMNIGSNEKSNNLQWEHDDLLPEWATENPTDCGGSFDSTGAFHQPDDINDADSNKIPIRKEFVKRSNENDIKDKSLKIQNNEKIETVEPKNENVNIENSESDNYINNNCSVEVKQNTLSNENDNEKITQKEIKGMPKNVPPGSDISDRMTEAANDMVQKLIMDDEIGVKVANQQLNMSSNKSNLLVQQNNTVPNNIQNSSILQQPLINNHTRILPAQSLMPDVSDLWYYRDPQGKVQGPFAANEMIEWYRAGYFDESLYVRRVCDSRYASLGELIKVCGNSMPFSSAHLIPPLGLETPLQHVHLINPTDGPQSSLSNKPNIANHIISGNDGMSVNMQLQALQKQYILRQQALILDKLTTTEPWGLLNHEQQQQLLNQQMSQIVLPDYLMSLSALGNSLSMINPSTYALQKMLANVNNEINQSKPTAPNLITPMPMFSGNLNDYVAPSSLQNILHSNPPSQPNVTPTNTNLLPNLNGIGNMTVKSILMQLQLQKNMQTQIPPSSGVQQLQKQWATPIDHSRPPWAPKIRNSLQETVWDYGSIPENKSEMHTEEQKSKSEEIKIKNLEKPEEKNVTLDEVVTKVKSHSIQSVKKEKSKQNEEHTSKTQKNDNDVKKATKPKSEKKENSTKKVDKEALEEKKKVKEEKKRLLAEEEKRKQQILKEEEKLVLILEEKKRQESIEQLRRSKMFENKPQSSVKSIFENNKHASSVAPWSTSSSSGFKTGPGLAEIQKAEKERRAEEQRLEQIHEQQRRAQQIEILVNKENLLKWNSKSVKQVNVKSLAEIQAEEHKRHLANEQSSATGALIMEQNKKKDDISNQENIFNSNTFNTIWNTRSSDNVPWNGKAWSATNITGFWEEPTKLSNNSNKQISNPRQLSKSQTISNIQSVKASNSAVSKQQLLQQSNQFQSSVLNNSSIKQTKNINSSKNMGNSNLKNNSTMLATSNLSGNNIKKDDARSEFTNWCIKTLSTTSNVDGPTFVSFLQDIESPFEVKDYVKLYLGDTKESLEFAKQFLERRSKYKNQQRAQNAHIDDMCSPAPAINPSSNDFQEVKGKNRKPKKNKMTKVDAGILGFSVTAAQDRINVGDRDYGDAT